MAQSTTYIESEIHGARQALDANVEELEHRIHTATDWRHHYGQRPVPWIGVALMGGAIAGLSNGRHTRVGEPAGTRPRRAASDMERTLVGMLDDTIGALVAVAAGKIRNAISEAVPGFREEVANRTEAQGPIEALTVGGRRNVDYPRHGIALAVTARVDVTLRWSELARRALRDSVEDDIMGQAAQLAYYLFLTLFPALLFVLAVASFFPLAAATDDMARQLGPFVSPQVLELIQEQMRRLANQDSGGLLTVGVAGALWSSSAAMVSVSSALNRAYDIEEGRPWWKVRLTAIALTFGVALFIVVAWTLVLIGPASARWLADAGMGPVAEWTWRIMQWPLAFGLVTIAIGLVYYFAPDAEQDWAWITPGSLVATTLWLIASLAFRLYVTNFTDYTGAYGAVGGVIVLMLWFYISSVAILAGAEFNAEIEHASPHGKGPGQKTAAGKRMLGARAARAFATAAQPVPRPSPATVPLSPAAASPSPAGLLVGFVIAWRMWGRRRAPTPPRPSQGNE